MDHKPRILVVGSFVMDVIATTERVPASAQTVYGKSFHMAPGGKGANQALQCARLGAQVTMMGCVGDDLFGQALLDTPRQSGVDVSRVLVRPGVTSGCGPCDAGSDGAYRPEPHHRHPRCQPHSDGRGRRLDPSGDHLLRHGAFAAGSPH